MAFDYVKALEDYKCPFTFKKGLEYYFKSNNLEPKSKKEFDKIIEDYSKITM